VRFSEAQLRMTILRNSFRLQNKDLRWYRDKYLAIVCFVCLVGAISLVSDWPPGRPELFRGLRFLGVAALCLIFSPRRAWTFTGVMVLVLTRAVVGFVVYHSVGALVVALASAALVYAVALRAHADLQTPYQIHDYSYAELAIDCAVLGSLLVLYKVLA
jgi:hypothetical protein